ncbi:hypothetical protein [Thermospira aquatica]|uniref:Uncharacterized protein n=1 Tax=Thermospira aquatica TaxID=2828656 RepID=A0AAX3BDS4_9SPIR|nr:hypothetical protein [Thermospira aquatica]URA10255.1 hypothetical protein KDW03_00150 [Thermospira aquatica]
MVSHTSQWNWSHGCQTIYRDDFEEFAKLFGGKKSEDKWAFAQSVYGKEGRSFIVTQ